ncbi:hypothetical protein GGR50DRAFT_426381 [Xylaria sp. CBS 124048]|nr:hypothetical protein GGR50DRAFT_426381 [Xylaria sp. CBS 124048]
MAEPAPDFQLPHDSFFNIYADAPTTSSPLSLPGGPCNYIDLTPGAGGHKCGCRRFWSRASLGRPERGSPGGYISGFTNGYEDQTAWCMCSHHACFHDDVRESQTPISNPVVAPSFMNGQENERPRTNREPLTPVTADVSLNPPYSMNQLQDFNSFAYPASFPHGHEGQGHAPPNATVQSPTDSPLPDTLAWASLVQPNTNRARSIPPIPSQCLMPSQPSSTTSSARIAYLKPFAGKGLNTLSGVRSRVLETLGEEGPLRVPGIQDAAEADAYQSADDLQTVANTPRSTRLTDITQGSNRSSTRRANGVALHLLSNTVQGHEQRLESLESMSFSAAGHDICHEKHDQADLRVTELETRVDEVEKILSDTSGSVSHFGRSRHIRTGDTTPSVVSVSTSSDGYNMSRAELQSELQFMRAELSRIQFGASLRSQFWEVEVIFLPFRLQNLWSRISDFGDQYLSNNCSAEPDPWTKILNSSEPQSPNVGQWTEPYTEPDWLLGRACFPNKLIARRLRSRGLVKTVSVRGPDARSVQRAMSEAFGDLFRTFSRMQANVHHGSTMHHCFSQYLGLQSPWIPLRKLYKDSRLRFLTPAEMVTPVAWDVQFLSSSVVMKSGGVHYLYITHPEAYIQDGVAHDNAWTWQRLRELPRVYEDSQSTQATVEGDDDEECWDFNSVLDEPPDSGSHIHSEQQVQSSAQEHWQRMPTMSAPNGVPNARATPSSVGIRRSASRALSPTMPQEMRVFKPPRGVRTTSVPRTEAINPPATRAIISPAATNKRRASMRHVTPQPSRSAPEADPVPARNKRRSTRSPSVLPRVNRFTPGYTASPTPMPDIRRRRTTTPCYATPHSNAPYVDARRPKGIFHNESMDVDVYDEEALDDDGYGDDYSMADMDYGSHESSQNSQLPEDKPWPGIEDDENRDPNANVFMADYAGMSRNSVAIPATVVDEDEHDAQSQSSSVPSEYPSNEPHWITSSREQTYVSPQNK